MPVPRNVDEMDATEDLNEALAMNDISLNECTTEGAKLESSLLGLHQKKTKVQSILDFRVEESPQFCATIVLGLQHYLTMFGGCLAVPFLLAKLMCFDKQSLVLAEMFNAMLFASGIGTLLQVLLGVRLPVVVSGSFAYIGPVTALMTFSPYACAANNWNETQRESTNFSHGMNQSKNIFMHSPKEDSLQAIHDRINLVAGSIMVSALLQMIVGFSGIIGTVAHFIGPLTSGPVVCVVGLHLYPVAVKSAGTSWMISIITILLVLIFTLYLAEVPVPIPLFLPRRGCLTVWFKAFKLFPLILAVVVSWILCAILTATGYFPIDPSKPSYAARTDVRLDALHDAKWFQVPYPGRWGRPIVTYAGVFGMVPVVISTIIGYVGDLYACQRVCEVPPLPSHAINRSVGIGGLATLICGAFGVGTGLTTYSENIGAIKITKVASRRVIVVAACFMMAFGVLGKAGALVTTIPDPVIGGLFLVLFGLITAIGISILSEADTGSARNLTIAGVSIFSGMGIPYYMKSHPNAINTGVKEIDQLLGVIVTTEITICGLVAVILDNTAPGTLEERGIHSIHKTADQGEIAEYSSGAEIYDLPSLLQKVVSKWRFARYLPFLPYHRSNRPTTPDKNDA